jgi:hypothetical protein
MRAAWPIRIGTFDCYVYGIAPQASSSLLDCGAADDQRSVALVASVPGKSIPHL